MTSNANLQHLTLPPLHHGTFKGSRPLPLDSKGCSCDFISWPLAQPRQYHVKTSQWVAKVVATLSASSLFITTSVMFMHTMNTQSSMYLSWASSAGLISIKQSQWLNRVTIIVLMGAVGSVQRQVGWQCCLEGVERCLGSLELNIKDIKHMVKDTEGTN